MRLVDRQLSIFRGGSKIVCPFLREIAKSLEVNNWRVEKDFMLESYPKTKVEKSFRLYITSFFMVSPPLFFLVLNPQEQKLCT